jgi:hypothetical protein
VLTAQGRTTRLLLSPAPRALCALYRAGPHSHLSAAILLLHHNRTARIPLCRVLPA